MGIRILLPPSEGKAEGGDAHNPWNPKRLPPTGTTNARSRLATGRVAVARALRTAGGGSPAMLGVSGRHLDRARAANSSLVGAPCLPAWRRYTGVVWDHLDLESMTAAERRRAVSSIHVVSGLGGLVRADEPMPDYRLKMSATLAPLGPLARWWRPVVTECLAAITRGATVVDLLPQEHRGAIEWEELDHDSVVRIDLVAKKSGAAGGHDAKAAKGSFARHLIETGDVDAAVRTFENRDFTARLRA